ncbi:MAG: hypothetical protein AB9M60_11495 [Leptothrix sp. (in: b-proteobacteria)]
MPIQKPLLSILLLAPALAAAGPYSLSVSETVSHDSNVFRAPSGAGQDDTISLTGLRVGLDQPYGRQRVRANAGLQMTRFNSLSHLNFTAPNADLRWDWSSAERLEGDVSLGHTEQLYTSSLNGTAITGQQRSVQKTSSAAARARLGMVTSWTLDGGAALQTRNYTLASQDNQDQRRQSVDLGTRYQPNPDLQVRALLRRSRGQYPRFSTTLGADRFSRTDAELGTTVALGGSTDIDARLARSREVHSQAIAGASSFWSGSMGLQWRASGKLGFSARLVRDSDTGGQDASNPIVTSNATLANSLNLGANWAFTEKLRFSTGWQHIERQLQRSISLGGSSASASARDTTNQYSLGSTFQPTRTVLLGLDWSHYQKSSGDTALLGAAYRGQVVALSATLTLD